MANITYYEDECLFDALTEMTDEEIADLVCEIKANYNGKEKADE